MSTITLPLAGQRADLVPVAERPLVGKPVAVLVMAFCAITPFTGSSLLWPVAGGLVLSEVLRNRAAVDRIQLPLPLVMLMSWMLLSTLWSVEPSQTVLKLAINFGYVLFGLLIAVNRRLGDLLQVFMLSACILLTASWLVTYLVPSVGRMQDTAYVGAMRGVFIQKNLLGYFAVLATIAGLCHAWRPESFGRSLLTRWGPAVLGFATLLASTSKTALSVCVAGIAFGVALAGLARVRRPLALPLTGALAGSTLFGGLVAANWPVILRALGRDATLTGRTEIWHVLSYAIKQRPLLGYGWAALWIDGSPTTIRLWARNYGEPFYHAHNGYLDLAAQLGLVGVTLSVFLLLWLLVVYSSRFFAKPSVTAGWPVVLLVVNLMYNFTEVISFTNTTWLLLVALAAMASSNRKADRCPSPMRQG